MVKFKRSSKVKRELINTIKEKEVQLSKLKAHIDKSSICSDLYNKVVLEKAILKKELEMLEENKFLKKIRSILPRKKNVNLRLFQKLTYCQL